jgi:uncharacterized protein (TIGR02001 family)
LWLVLGAIAWLGAPPAAVAQSAAPGVDGYLTLSNGYWNRGLAQTDGGIALQAGVDYQHPSGFFAGGALADVDYAADLALGEQRELQIDAYFGYHRRRPEWAWTLTLGRYLYPDAGGRYEHTEVGASIGFRDRVFFSASYADDFFSLNRSALDTEVAVAYPLAWNLEVSAALGRFDLDLSSQTQFTHWNVGISKIARRVALDLRYYDNDYDLLSPLGDGASNQLVLSVSYAFRRREL